MTRAVCVCLHRWAGLAMAGFLLVVGLTSGLLAFHNELNGVLAPELHPARAGVAFDPARLARRAEALVPQARATTVYLGYVGGAQIGMEPRENASPLDFSALVLDPATGEELGRLNWGGWPTTPAAVMPFVYALHYQLAAGEVGEWILGLVALVWTIDCFVAFYLTLPPPAERARKGFFARWKPSWLIKLSGSFYRVNFDLHRAGGLWLWAVLLIFAWSSVAFNLNGLYARATNLFLDYEPPAWTRHAAPREDAAKPLEWEEAERIGRALMAEQARAHGFSIERALALYIIRDKSYCEYRVRSSRDIGDRGGSTSVYFDAYTGALQSVNLPTGHRAGNTLATWLTELHIANLFGLPYKIFVSALGLAVAMLSVTGVYIWQKKRRARMKSRRVPAGASSVRVSRSWRSVVSVAWSSVTAAAKRIQQSRGV